MAESEVKKLILIKHSRPVIDPLAPARRWRLSAEGRALCGPLAQAIRPHRPAAIVTSDEPKAAETGQRLAEALSVPVTAAPGLHEHDRTNVPHMRSADFISSVANFFRQPERLVFGRETANQAADRFGRAVEAVIADHSHDCIAIVSHGTVISLLARARAGLEPFGLWRRLGLPSFMVFELPDWRVVETVERVGGD